MKPITLYNVSDRLKKGGVIQKERIYHPGNKWRKYKLLKDVMIVLSNSRVIIIPAGFEWDLSSVPRFLWAFLPPDGDFEIAALIHDFLYRYNLENRKFADDEMLLWSKITNGTIGFSMPKIDNFVRYKGVRWFGYFAWHKTTLIKSIKKKLWN